MSSVTYDHVIEVDLRVYPIEVIFRVCYLYTNRWYMWLDYRNDCTLAVYFMPKVQESMSFAVLKGEFGNSLIDFGIRLSVSIETKEIREQLAKTALSEALRTNR